MKGGVEPLEVRPRHPAHGLLGALRDPPVGVLAVERAREGDAGEGGRLVPPLEEIRQQLPADPLQLVLRKSRPQEDVGEDREGLSKALGGDIETDRRLVPPRAAERSPPR